jgi:hypothetical protein
VTDVGPLWNPPHSDTGVGNHCREQTVIARRVWCPKRDPLQLVPPRPSIPGLVSLACSSSIEGSAHHSLNLIPFEIFPREKCYNGVFMRLWIRSHPSVYLGDSYMLKLS